jgi:hypothetical protein
MIDVKELTLRAIAAQITELEEARDRILNGEPLIPVAQSTSPSDSRKGGMSAEGRARVSAAAKARWAAIREAKEKALSPEPEPARNKLVNHRKPKATPTQATAN